MTPLEHAVKKGAEALGPDSVYQGYSEETKAYLLAGNLETRKRQARAVLTAVGLHELLEAAREVCDGPPTIKARSLSRLASALRAIEEPGNG